MLTATGIVTVAQESRFRIVTADGQSKLFILAHNASLEPQDLGALQRDQTRITVHYTEVEPLLAGIAHDLVEAPKQ